MPLGSALAGAAAAQPYLGLSVVGALNSQVHAPMGPPSSPDGDPPGVEAVTELERTLACACRHHLCALTACVQAAPAGDLRGGDFLQCGL